jgi:hypothetical protein
LNLLSQLGLSGQYRLADLSGLWGQQQLRLHLWGLWDPLGRQHL